MNWLGKTLLILLGPYISGFLYGTPMPARVKRIALVLLWIGVIISSGAVWYQIKNVTLMAVAYTLLLAVGVGFIIYPVRLPVGEVWRDTGAGTGGRTEGKA